ncbi:MAG: gluconate 2-dehydrogenase subunit 3 family protein [Flavobacteriales bacterium]|nr:gluconate 2-dehydrogenase subunit 3 family protein [Flavobacteriia bacterium]NCP05208.1 gluconate 2-dehydrogenase subunit 3 family protein [Flavobacteriales bacterium]PIV94050.1 MAG: gluconate 2-dehydrogenase [Flavobacteriaceae bacterium CG17_big_fil_post_rev_8_21_14_2_50_33_15]PIY10954.1 MAG: gluconate 2-dehydrogenase [Flavobacteriaceae bacterium CG_4_10_14_3_um_filter_33_47]PJB20037.1 MAG: gluconate 2-dehydrogenase [Flavobacteriaceae bacterium CG_4_9_14_3_um_filter_33_16]
MKRREALKNLGFATGFFVATPAIVSILQSCTSDVKTWVPEFLTLEQGIVLTNLVDIILPKTDLPSATEMNVPQFIDKYVNEVLDIESQEQVKAAFSTMVSILKPKTEDPIDKLTPQNYKALLDKYMLIKGEIDEERVANPESLELTKSEFLNSLKWMTINAYVTTEQIGETVLKYDPIPAAYYCGDLQELTGGRSWSL